jgi:hypothetical protein
VRAPGAELHLHGTLWLLTQGETRKTKRVRLFTEFISRRLAAYAPLLAGLSVSRTDARQVARRRLPQSGRKPSCHRSKRHRGQSLVLLTVVFGYVGSAALQRTATSAFGV